MGKIPPEFTKKVREVAKCCEGVLGVHDIRLHYFGPDLGVNLHIEVDKELSVAAGHKIADCLEKELKKQVKSLKIAVVHVDICQKH